MEKLKELFEDLLWENINIAQELDPKDVSEACASLVEGVAIQYACKAAYMCLHPELEDKSWEGVFDSKTAYNTIKNNFKDFIENTYE